MDYTSHDVSGAVEMVKKTSNFYPLNPQPTCNVCQSSLIESVQNWLISNKPPELISPYCLFGWLLQDLHACLSMSDIKDSDYNPVACSIQVVHKLSVMELLTYQNHIQQ